MTAIRFDPWIDLQICEAMADELENYLASEGVYWQMNPAPSGNFVWPKLTVAGVLERLRRLHAYADHLSPEQRARLERAQRRLETTITTHKGRYLDKISHELKSYLDAWEWFLDDYAQRPDEVAAYYPNEVRDRLKIALLLEVMRREAVADISPQVERLQALDEHLRADFVSGQFVWDTALATAFPPEDYWWLYGELKKDQAATNPPSDSPPVIL